MKKIVMLVYLMVSTNVFGYTLRPQSEWKPGATCYSDAAGTEYADWVMFMCDCTLDGTDYMNPNDRDWPLCTDTYIEQNGFCRMGTKTECLGTDQNTIYGSQRTVTYMCQQKSMSGSNVCHCDRAQAAAVDLPEKHMFTQKTAVANCSLFVYSIKACDGSTTEMSWSSVYTKYACSLNINTSTKTVKMCYANYYLPGTNYTECEPCPSLMDIDGVDVAGKSGYQNTNGITECYVPKNSGTFGDDMGLYIFTDNCNYSK